ncbi:MAG TPA: hypothetical protein VGP68_00380 [Gemmataceae bacterium]|jgi:hypothetical protein|nr:hypothetical protein [Gemmataceae bacterium]
MIELTEQQWQEAAMSEPLAVNPRTGESYVLIPKSLYDRVKDLLYVGQDLTPEEQGQLLASSGKRAGWDDPEMDAYDNYDENFKKLGR